METQVDFPVDIRSMVGLMEEQGHDVTDLRDGLSNLRKNNSEADPARHAELRRRVLDMDRRFYDDQLKNPSEPSGLPEILSARPAHRADRTPVTLRAAELEDRIAGGWYGRLAGCALGNPFEAIGADFHYTWREFRDLLTSAGHHPLADYISEKDIVRFRKPDGTFEGTMRAANLRERLDGSPGDDDINYTIMALKAVRELGREFTPDAMLDKWCYNLPVWQLCGAERTAYLNRALGHCAPDTAILRNGQREEIGAQIRADLYGFISPGDTAGAARMAWSDAAATHVRNGIYGAMWVAAMIAAAFEEPEPVIVIARGLEQIPPSSRLAKAVKRTAEEAFRNRDNHEKTYAFITDTYGQYGGAHVVNNACVVAAALIHGNGDFTRSISIAVMAGLDTDCNGATVGAIAGVMRGKSGIPAHWVAPLKDTVQSSVKDYSPTTISRLVQETVGLVTA